MSGTTAQIDEATFKDIMARIDRQQAETQKFAAEQTKLAAEASKLTAETLKLRGDRFIGPVVAVASIIGACGGIVAAYAGLVRLAH